MKFTSLMLSIIAAGMTFSSAPAVATNTTKTDTIPKVSGQRVDRFADIEVLRYDIPGFAQLPLNKKLFIYYLNEAALWGRDILWDQNGEHNLALRVLLEQIYNNYAGHRDDPNWLAFQTYLKQVEFGNGVYHHYSTDKFVPGFTKEWLVTHSTTSIDPVLLRLIFDPTFLPKRVNQAAGADVVATSACNFYHGLKQSEVEEYYAARKDTTDLQPISYGLNTRLSKAPDGSITEETYRLGGLYSPAIEKIVENLFLAFPYAETQQQKDVITSLIKYYTSGDLKDWDRYSILWTEDTTPQVDFINGFIESYGDPLGMTGSWESIVNYRNDEASERTSIISANAQWFEDHSPVDSTFRKPQVKGVSAKVINAAILCGDAYPAPPIGINLPNANWIRAAHGSKSVSIENLTQAYADASKGNGMMEEFAIDASTVELISRYGFLTDNLHTDLHECLGHGSGRLLPGVDPDALREHGSTLEETRADLFGLYFLADPKLVELGLVPDSAAYQAEYYKYMLNGLMTQLMRILPGKQIEEAHMRNRALITHWVLEKAKQQTDGQNHAPAVELIKHVGKTYVKVNDYPALRGLFGQLLAEIQRIKSTGDYLAGAALVEKYAVDVDPALHSEVLDRYSRLDIAPYKGFVNPVYTLQRDAEGNPTDVVATFTEGYLPQHFRYSAAYSPLTH